MFVVGFGMGLIIQVMIIAVQNSVEHKDLGTATGAETFVRSMGGAFGVAVFGAIFNNRMAVYLSHLLPTGVRTSAVNATTVTASPAALHQLPPALMQAVLQAIAQSTHVVFLASVPLVLMAFGLTFLLREIPLRRTAHIGVEEQAAVEPEMAS
jgi:hypothetical protein